MDSSASVEIMWDAIRKCRDNGLVSDSLLLRIIACMLLWFCALTNHTYLFLPLTLRTLDDPESREDLNGTSEPLRSVENQSEPSQFSKWAEQRRELEERLAYQKERHKRQKRDHRLGDQEPGDLGQIGIYHHLAPQEYQYPGNLARVQEHFARHPVQPQADSSSDSDTDQEEDMGNNRQRTTATAKKAEQQRLAALADQERENELLKKQLADQQLMIQAQQEELERKKKENVALKLNSIDETLGSKEEQDKIYVKLRDVLIIKYHFAQDDVGLKAITRKIFKAIYKSKEERNKLGGKAFEENWVVANMAYVSRQMNALRSNKQSGILASIRSRLYDKVDGKTLTCPNPEEFSRLLVLDGYDIENKEHQELYMWAVDTVLPKVIGSHNWSETIRRFVTLSKATIKEEPKVSALVYVVTALVARVRSAIFRHAFPWIGNNSRGNTTKNCWSDKSFWCNMNLCIY